MLPRCCAEAMIIDQHRILSSASCQVTPCHGSIAESHVAYSSHIALEDLGPKRDSETGSQRKPEGVQEDPMQDPDLQR